MAQRAVRVEGRSNLLFSFEKMALRDALRDQGAAQSFSAGLYAFLYGPGTPKAKFERWRAVVAGLPRKQSRVLTWPVLTVFPFLASPSNYIYLKPAVTRAAAERYGFDFIYHSVPDWETYASMTELAATVRNELADMKPRDMIDIQSFLWVLGSSEYDE